MLKDILKLEREKLGLTQAQLSKKLNVSQQAIGSWETGRTQPSIETLQQIADFFGVSLDYLLDRNYKLFRTNNLNSILYETYGKYLSIDEQLNIVIEKLNSSNTDLIFKDKPIGEETKLTLLNSLKNIMVITEKINRIS